VVVIANPDVGNRLIEEEPDALEKLEKRLEIQIRVDTSGAYHREQFEVRFEENT
jgi:hypothetical protein